MIAYTLRRLVFAAFVIWGVATITFLLTHIDVLEAPVNWVRESPPFSWPAVREDFRIALGMDLSKPVHFGMGDPARLLLGQHGDVNTVAEIRRDLGLDQPLWVQYKTFLVGHDPRSAAERAADPQDKAHRVRYGLLRGDLGVSFKTRQPALDRILQYLPKTAMLAVAAMLVAVVVGVSAGVMGAVWQDRLIDRFAMTGAILGLSAPIYLVGLILILVFVKRLGWIPGVGLEESLAPLLQIWLPGMLVEWRVPVYLILPSIALGLRPASNLARMTRSSMLEVIRQDFVRTARAKGLPESRVVLVHALKNALIPVVTVIGLELAGLLTGAVLTETVFAWPGLGRLAVQALRDLDLPMIQATVVFIALFFVISNLIVDLLYAWLDPRIRLT